MLSLLSLFIMIISDSPMGLNVSAVSSEAEFKIFLANNGGTKLGWVDVIELVKQKSM